MSLNNKGLSQVITVVIFIALALVLIGIVWTITNNILEENVDKAKTSQECLGLSVTPIAISNCDSDSCDITVERSATGGSIEGIRVKFLNTAGDNSHIEDIEKNINASQTITLEVPTGEVSGDVGKVEISPYLRNSKGEITICSNIKSLLKS